MGSNTSANVGSGWGRVGGGGEGWVGWDWGRAVREGGGLGYPLGQARSPHVVSFGSKKLSMADLAARRRERRQNSDNLFDKHIGTELESGTNTPKSALEFHTSRKWPYSPILLDIF